MFATLISTCLLFQPNHLLYSQALPSLFASQQQTERKNCQICTLKKKKKQRNKGDIETV